MNALHLQYLKNIVKLESDFYLMTKFIPQINRATSSLRESVEPNYPRKMKWKDCVEVVGTGGLVLGIVIGVASALFGSQGVFDMILRGIFGSLGLSLMCGLIGLCLSPVICFVVNTYRKSKYQKEKKAAYPYLMRIDKRDKIIDHYVKEIHLAWIDDNRDIVRAYYKKGNIPESCRNLKTACVIMEYMKRNESSLAEAVRYGSSNGQVVTQEYNSTVFLMDKMAERLVTDLISQSASETFKIQNSTTYQYVSKILKEEKQSLQWLEKAIL